MPARAAKSRVGCAGKAVLNRLCLKFLLNCPANQSEKPWRWSSDAECRGKKSFLRGCVYFDKRRGALECLIRDISDLGARIIFSENVNVPETVELHIPQRNK